MQTTEIFDCLFGNNGISHAFAWIDDLVEILCNLNFSLHLGNDAVDTVRKTYTKRGRKRSSDDEGSSDGEQTLELASSHSSDEDEAAGTGHNIRNATLGKCQS